MNKQANKRRRKKIYQARTNKLEYAMIKTAKFCVVCVVKLLSNPTHSICPCDNSARTQKAAFI